MKLKNGGMFNLNDCNLKCQSDNYTKILNGACYKSCLNQIINDNIRNDLKEKYKPLFKRTYNKHIDNSIKHISINRNIYNGTKKMYSYLKSNEFTVMKILFKNKLKGKYSNDKYYNFHFVIIAKDEYDNCLLFDPKWNILLKNDDALNLSFPNKFNIWLDLITFSNNNYNLITSLKSGDGNYDLSKLCYNKYTRIDNLYNNEHNTKNTTSVITDLYIYTKNKSVNYKISHNTSFNTTEYYGWIRKNDNYEYFLEKNQRYNNFIVNAIANIFTCKRKKISSTKTVSYTRTDSKTQKKTTSPTPKITLSTSYTRKKRRIK
jgi:hypothetical protein